MVHCHHISDKEHTVLKIEILYQNMIIQFQTMPISEEYDRLEN